MDLNQAEDISPLGSSPLPGPDNPKSTEREKREEGICRCVGIRQIDGARSNFYLAVRVSGIPRQKSVDSQDRSYARPVGFKPQKHAERFRGVGNSSGDENGRMTFAYAES